MTDNTPHVAIIILNWNQEVDTLECLASVARVEYPALSIIIVDNGSTSDTYETIVQWSRQEPRAIVIRMEQNLGFVGGSNAGIHHALQGNTDYILLLNNDTVVTPEFISRLVAVAEQADNIGIVGPKVYQYQEERIFDSAGTRAYFWLAQGMLRAHGESDEGQYDREEDVPYITGCALLIKRTVIEKIGLMDEDYFNYFDDLDWGYRTKLAGYRLIYVPKAVIQHKGSQAMGLGSPFYFHHMIRSRILFARKHIGWFLFITCFLPYLTLYRYLLPVLRFLRLGHWTHLRALHQGIKEGFTTHLTSR
ncbi:uncharacterized protein METZ01_LOCUS160366 [marine metagenome]|uniref:Glycosyltransferase 2-like domain-containing protein n=1 Tax=marine metagenome TaxID=408172 RepID=A0A382B2I8_9ZZZZ